MIFLCLAGFHQYMYIILTCCYFPFVSLNITPNQIFTFESNLTIPSRCKEQDKHKYIVFVSTLPCMSLKPKEDHFCDYHLKVLKIFIIDFFWGFFKVQFTKTTNFSWAEKIVFFYWIVQGDCLKTGSGVKIAADEENGGNFNSFFIRTTSEKN